MDRLFYDIVGDEEIKELPQLPAEHPNAVGCNMCGGYWHKSSMVPIGDGIFYCQPCYTGI